ncbi:MAG: hypothetical protein IJX55_07900 [Clostridia bacterium]|nr:hypothetical protein [Clostridia bacterium]
MPETIYTIPINEAFDKTEESETPSCPFCELYEMLENNALEAVMGAAMMEPDIRIETNRLGFCRNHFNRIYEKGNRLGLALILESHIAEVNEKVFKKPLFDSKGEKSEKAIESISESCYLCNKIAYSLTKMFSNTIYIWETDEDFRRKFKNQRCFCLPHYRKLLQYGRNDLDKKQFAEFFEVAKGIEKKYIESLGEDVSWFCKKFDYRYDNEPWGTAKDSVPRALDFLSGGKTEK